MIFCLVFVNCAFSSVDTVAGPFGSGSSVPPVAMDHVGGDPLAQINIDFEVAYQKYFFLTCENFWDSEFVAVLKTLKVVSRGFPQIRQMEPILRTATSMLSAYRVLEKCYRDALLVAYHALPPAKLYNMIINRVFNPDTHDWLASYSRFLIAVLGAGDDATGIKETAWFLENCLPKLKIEERLKVLQRVMEMTEIKIAGYRESMPEMDEKERDNHLKAETILQGRIFPLYEKALKDLEKEKGYEEAWEAFTRLTQPMRRVFKTKTCSLEKDPDITSSDPFKLWTKLFTVEPKIKRLQRMINETQKIIASLPIQRPGEVAAPPLSRQAVRVQIFRTFNHEYSQIIDLFQTFSDQYRQFIGLSAEQLVAMHHILPPEKLYEDIMSIDVGQDGRRPLYLILLSSAIPIRATEEPIQGQVAQPARVTPQQTSIGFHTVRKFISDIFPKLTEEQKIRSADRIIGKFRVLERNQGLFDLDSTALTLFCREIERTLFPPTSMGTAVVTTDTPYPHTQSGVPHAVQTLEISLRELKQKLEQKLKKLMPTEGGPPPTRIAAADQGLAIGAGG